MTFGALLIVPHGLLMLAYIRSFLPLLAARAEPAGIHPAVSNTQA
jgi:hypothetical protein